MNTTQDFLNSEEQGLQIRTTIGGGAGLFLIEPRRSIWPLGQASRGPMRTTRTITVPTKNSAEAYFGTEFMTEK